MIVSLNGLEVGLISSTGSVTLDPGANTGGTLTLPATVGLAHYITAIRIARSATAALAGGATLQITTTNLPGSPFWRVGNAMAAGGTLVDVDEIFANPLRAVAQNTNTTFVLPVPGAAVLWTATIWFFLGQ